MCTSYLSFFDPALLELEAQLPVELFATKLILQGAEFIMDLKSIISTYI